MPAEVLEWSLAPGSGGLSGLPTDEKQPEGGLQRVDRFIHHVQSLHPSSLQRDFDGHVVLGVVGLHVPPVLVSELL